MKINDAFEVNFSITEEDYNAFIRLSGDKNPMHTSATYAKGHGFKDKIVHGNLLSAYISYFVGERLPYKNIVIQKQEISFHKPFFIDDSLSMTILLKEIFESVSTYLFKFKFLNQEQSLIAKGSVQIGLIK